jgi:hypothetical protein
MAIYLIEKLFYYDLHKSFIIYELSRIYYIKKYSKVKIKY